MENYKQKIILDTDIGDDIDDAFALAYILKSGGFNLLGITTVFRDTDKRARIAKMLLSRAGVSDVPVIAGHCDGLKISNEKLPVIQFTDDFLDTRYEADEKGTQAEFYKKMCEAYPGEVILCGIGPYTNIADFILKYPESAKKLKKIVVMGGTFFEHHREWNAICDVDATKVLFESGLPLECVGFDVTQRVQLCYRQHKFILDYQGDDAVCSYLSELTKLWTSNSWRSPLLHDPLVFEYLLHPEILSMKEVLCAVETQGEYTKGMTVNLDTITDANEHLVDKKRIKAACCVDSKRAVDNFMKTIFSYQ